MSRYNPAPEVDEKEGDSNLITPLTSTMSYGPDNGVSERAASATSLSRCCTHERDHELRPYVSPRNGDKHIHVDTLGEGPVAPRAAAETVVAAEKGIEDVSPGVKGWVCLLGVSGDRAS